MGDTRDPEEIAKADVETLSNEELMVAIGAYAQQKGEATAVQDLVAESKETRQSGPLPALRDTLPRAHKRLSLDAVEERKSSIDERAEQRDEKLDEYLTEATARFDDPSEDTQSGDLVVVNPFLEAMLA